MAKFVEKDFAKMDRVVQLHAKYVAMLEDYDKGSANAPNVEYEDRLEHGLYTLQMVDLVIGFIYSFPMSSEEEGQVVRLRMVELLNQRDSDIDEVKAVLTAYCEKTRAVQGDDADGQQQDGGGDDDSLGAIAGKLVQLM